MGKLKYKDLDGNWKDLAPSQKEFDDNKNEVASKLAETEQNIGLLSTFSDMQWVMENPSVVQAILDMLEWQKSNMILAGAPPYNVNPDGFTDNTSVMEIIMNDAKVNGKPVKLPAGTIISEITLKNNVFIMGSGIRTTYIKAPQGSLKPFLIDIEPGQVQRSGMIDLCVQGNGNTGQGGIKIEGTKGTQSSGGLWHSYFKNIEVREFDGTCWHFSGGYDSSQATPNQFIRLEGCIGARSDSASSLIMEGQCEHFTFLNCTFSGGSGSSKGFGTIVNLRRKRGSDGTSVLGDQAPINIDFIGCTTENGRLGMNIERAYNVSIENQWFEQLYQGINVNTVAKVSVKNSHFANASSDGSGGGFGIFATTDSYVLAEANNFTGAQDKAFINDTASSFIARNNKGVIATQGLSKQPTVTSGVVDCKGYRTVLITTADVISTINTDLNPGETLTIISWNGSITFNSSGNLTLGGATSLTLSNKQSVQFTKFDLGVDLVLTSKGF